MSPQLLYDYYEEFHQSDGIPDQNDAIEKLTQLQNDLAEAKEALRDVKARRAKDRKDWFEEKRQRKKLEDKMYRLKSKPEKVKNFNTGHQPVQDAPAGFELLKAETERLSSAQNLLKSICDTLRQEKKTLETRIREYEIQVSRVETEARRWENNYMNQSKWVGTYKQAELHYQNQYEEMNRALIKAEKLVKELQQEKAEQTSKKRKFAAFLTDCGFTKDDFDPIAHRSSEVDKDNVDAAIVVDQAG